MEKGTKLVKKGSQAEMSPVASAAPRNDAMENMWHQKFMLFLFYHVSEEKETKYGAMTLRV